LSLGGAAVQLVIKKKSRNKKNRVHPTLTAGKKKPRL